MRRRRFLKAALGTALGVLGVPLLPRDPPAELTLDTVLKATKRVADKGYFDFVPGEWYVSGDYLVTDGIGQIPMDAIRDMAKDRGRIVEVDQVNKTITIGRDDEA